MNHHIILIFFAITIFLCNAAGLISADQEAPIAKSFLHSPTQCLAPPLKVLVAKPLEEPHRRLKGRKRRPPPPPSPPPPPLSFDHFKLAQTWPATFCKIPGKTCIADLPERFLIHGLWPQKIGECNKDKKMEEPNDGDIGPLKECNKDKKTIKPNFGDIDGALKSQLEQDWPSLLKDKNNIQLSANTDFWFRQWNKHGICSAELFNFHDYLQMGTILYHKDNNKIVDILQKKGIIHGRTFNKQDIFDAIGKHIGFNPQIQCKKIEDVSYLLEVKLCFTASKDPQYTSCDGYGSPFGDDCDDDVYF